MEKERELYRVLLLNSEDLSDSPELIYESPSRDDATVWVEAWEKEGWLGLVAVLWPPCAPIPL